mmetsp:Transcript_29943/g.69647  ORF Transcript_29943/g.69647 Transcript_29943/m.69647 type:complete len:304 (+) Transcript_29943:88-999(+)
MSASASTSHFGCRMTERNFVQKYEKYEPSCWYLIDAEWLKNWARYIHSDAPRPGPISNYSLLREDGRTPKTGLMTGKHYRGVCEEVWTFLQKRHGGGPMIRCKYLNLYKADLQIEDLRDHAAKRAPQQPASVSHVADACEYKVDAEESSSAPSSRTADTDSAASSNASSWSRGSNRIFGDGSSSWTWMTGKLKDLFPAQAQAAERDTEGERSAAVHSWANQGAKQPSGPRTSWPESYAVVAHSRKVWCQTMGDHDQSRQGGTSASTLTTSFTARQGSKNSAATATATSARPTQHPTRGRTIYI